MHKMCKNIGDESEMREINIFEKEFDGDVYVGFRTLDQTLPWGARILATFEDGNLKTKKGTHVTQAIVVQLALWAADLGPEQKYKYWRYPAQEPW